MIITTIGTTLAKVTASSNPGVVSEVLPVVVVVIEVGLLVGGIVSEVLPVVVVVIEVGLLVVGAFEMRRMIG